MSVIFINNEVGAVQPVEEIGDISKGINPNIILPDAAGVWEKPDVKMGADLIIYGGIIHRPKGH